MSISKYFLIFIILLAQGIRAESSLVLTLDSLANRIHRQNPDLAAARVRILETLGRVRQARRLANPELQLADEQKTNTNTETAWRGGQVEFQSVLCAREQRLLLAATRIDALREFHLASTRHQAAIGKP
jgi:hypothetical protein